MSKKAYNLSAKQAAEKLDKSVTTIHRYISKGKLNAKYVNTDHGREVRLKEKEVKKLSEKLNKLDSLQNGPPIFEDDYQNAISTRQLLERYERTLYQLGELTERLKGREKAKKNKINQLEKEKERLQSHLDDRAALIEALKSELNRPLTIKERLSGERSTNH